MADKISLNSLSSPLQVRVSHKYDKTTLINSSEGFDLLPLAWGQTEMLDGKTMAFKGVSRKSELEYNFQDENSFSSTVLSKWGTMRNVEVKSAEAARVDLAQYVHANVTLGGEKGEKTAITLNAIKGGTIETADADDVITIDAFTNGGGINNMFTINTGLGEDVINATGANGRTRFTVDSGEGNDEISLDGGFSIATLSLGEGEDSLIIKHDGDRRLRLDVDAGDGKDVLKIAGDLAKSSMILGNGDDELTLSTTGRAAPLTIDAGEGDDTLILEGIYAKSTIQLGNGNDQLTMNNKGSTPRVEVDAGEGDDSLSFEGEINLGNFTLGDGEDSLTVETSNPQSRFVIDAGADADTVLLQGSYKFARVSLGEGDDSFTGGAGRDIIDGGEGDDVLRGGLGRDHFSGGEGADSFIIDAEANIREVIEDFGQEDVIDLTAFDGLSLEAIAKQRGKHVQLELGENQFLTLKHTILANLTEANFLFQAAVEPGTGTEGDDLLTGSAQADSLQGLLGIDTLDGAGGDDTLTGGAGADQFVISPQDGHARITDFTPDEGDLIDLSGFTETLYFDDMQISHEGEDTVIHLGDATTLTLQAMTVDQLSVEHFRGVEPGSEPGIPGLRIEGTLQPLAVTERVTFQDLGELSFADFNGDGTTDIISQNGAFGQGLVWIDGSNMASNRLVYLDPGDHRLVDFNGDGTLDILSDAFGGLGWFDGTDTTRFNRITSNDIGDYRVADMDGDGALDIVSNMGSYANGAAINGAVWYDAAGALNRITYNNLGEGYRVADIDQDGAVEIISNDGTYASGVALKGLVYYELDGSITRHSFASDSNFIVGNFDDDAGLEILTNDAIYTSGAVAAGPVVFQGENVGSRFTYNNLGDFVIADIDGDGTIEIISNKGSYQSGDVIDGIMRYNLDGTYERIGYQDVEKLHVGDWNGDGVDDILATGGVAGSGIIRLNLASGNDDVLDGTENNDTLIGGGGDDTLTGGGADDIFEFGVEFGNDTITDFFDGTNQLLFTAETGVANVAEVVSAAEVVGENTVITLAEGSITLQGFTGLEASHITVL